MKYRLPFSALMTAIKGRLDTDVISPKFYSMPPQGTQRPYGRIVSLVSSEGSHKGDQYWTVTATLGVVGKHETAADVNGTLDAALGSLTGIPLTLTDDWFVDWVRPSGQASVQEASDNVELFWSGLISVVFRVGSAKTYGN